MVFIRLEACRDIKMAFAAKLWVSLGGGGGDGGDSLLIPWMSKVKQQ